MVKKITEKKYAHETENKLKYNISKYVHTAKAVLCGKFTALTRKGERSQINNPNLYLKKLEEKKEQINPKEVEGNKDRNK